VPAGCNGDRISTTTRRVRPLCWIESWQAGRSAAVTSDRPSHFQSDSSAANTLSQRDGFCAPSFRGPAACVFRGAQLRWSFAAGCPQRARSKAACRERRRNSRRRCCGLYCGWRAISDRASSTRRRASRKSAAFIEAWRGDLRPLAQRRRAFPCQAGPALGCNEVGLADACALTSPC
jgi:hypothetical protein